MFLKKEWGHYVLFKRRGYITKPKYTGQKTKNNSMLYVDSWVK